MAFLRAEQQAARNLETKQVVRVMTLPRDRAKYSAIIDRPKISLPNGERIVVWTIVNIETWDISRPMPRQVLVPPTGVTTLPDVPNWSWHEYGMRVGFWRFHALFERLKIKPSLSINAKVCLDYPRVAQACRESGWEFMGHSYDQRPIHSETDQLAMIQKTVATIKEFTGKAPIGWMGPGLTETYDTPDYLKQAGIKYTCDWVWDDEPAEIETKHGPFYTLPYTMETNDIPVMAVQYHEAPLLRAKMQRHVRSPLRRRRKPSENHGHCHSSLPQRAAFENQVSGIHL